MKTRLTVWIAAVLAILSLSLPAIAQEEPTTRKVEGLVMTQAEVPLAAVVQLKNMRTLDVKSFHTDEQGKYYFYGLDPNIDYEIRAIAEGYAAKIRKVSSFDDRMELFYEFVLEKAE